MARLDRYEDDNEPSFNEDDDYCLECGESRYFHSNVPGVCRECISAAVQGIDSNSPIIIL